MYDVKCEEIERTLIDLEDVNKCKNIKWTLTSNGYVISNNSHYKEGKLLHRFVMNCNEKDYIDHVNHNTLDNRKENLRICTPQENSFNRKEYKKDRNGLMGVFWCDRYKKWEIQIGINGVSTYITRVENEEEAIAIRLKAEEILFKEFAPNKNLYYIINNYEHLKNIHTIEELKKYYKIQSENKNNKLKDDIVKEIRQLYNDNVSIKKLADKYNVDKRTVKRIVFYETYKNII